MEYHNFGTPPENCVFFRGGSSGNFLTSTIFNNLYKDHIPDPQEYTTTYLPGWNEWMFRSEHPDRAILELHHLNLWFREENTQYGEEVYTPSRYRECLTKIWHNVNFIVIQPNHNIEFTENLSKMKMCIQSGYPHTPDEPYPLEFWRKIALHYNYFSWIARKKGINLIDVDYGELFEFNTRKEVLRICEFLKKPYSQQMVNDIKDYHSKNLELFNKHDYQLKLKPLT